MSKIHRLSTVHVYSSYIQIFISDRDLGYHKFLWFLIIQALLEQSANLKIENLIIPENICNNMRKMN